MIRPPVPCVTRQAEEERQVASVAKSMAAAAGVGR
jgi:hypothetical protein